MNNLVIDLTHGGVKIAISLAKLGKNVLAYDIYNTLNKIDAQMLQIYNVELIRLEDLKDFKGDMNIIYPIHMPLKFSEITKFNENLKFSFQTHHEVVCELLDGWGCDIKKVEITGVKGKTTSSFMLKEILSDENPLILSSLGAILYENNNEIILKRDISITPANIKECIDLAYRYANPICRDDEKIQKYSSAIFESSLGVSGIGDVGLLLNIVEDYPIAKGNSTASQAKKQVFRCPCVCIDKKTFDTYYSDIAHPKVNTFSLTDKKANLFIKEVSYSLDKTELTVEYNNVKTVNDNTLSGELTLKTFAPGPHYVSDALGCILTAISLEIDSAKIIKGLGNFKGITGRCFKRKIDESTIIEEINPGLNTEAIKESINMLDNLDDYYISIGGDYGITCEEIDEDKLVKFLEDFNKEIILTGDVGFSISSKLMTNAKYIEKLDDVYKLAVKEHKNLLFIYRSDYRKVSQR